MAVIRRMVFVGPPAFAPRTGPNPHRDAVRDAAEAFVNGEIGPDRVVSVSEHVSDGGWFTVAVWFRADDDGAAASASHQFSQADLRQQPRGFEVKVPGRTPAPPEGGRPGGT